MQSSFDHQIKFVCCCWYTSRRAVPVAGPRAVRFTAGTALREVRSFHHARHLTSAHGGRAKPAPDTRRNLLSHGTRAKACASLYTRKRHSLSHTRARLKACCLRIHAEASLSISYFCAACSMWSFSMFFQLPSPSFSAATACNAAAAAPSSFPPVEPGRYHSPRHSTHVEP